MPGRILSLAAGTVLDVDPAEAVDVAADTGWDAVGIWFDAASWTPATTTAVRRRLDATGITALDIEPVILGRDHDPGDALVDIAGEIGARHVLVASGPAERAFVVDRLAELCERAASVDVMVVLEFLPIFTVRSLADAVGIVEEVGHPSAAVLVDTLHLARSGGTPADLQHVPLRLFPYLQLADASAEPPATLDALREEALHGRLLPGEGGLPLRQTLNVVPDVPVSVELRSRTLMTLHPDPRERSQIVLAATRRVVAEKV